MRNFQTLRRGAMRSAVAAALLILLAAPAAGTESSPTLFGEDTRVTVADSAGTPYSAVSKLLITYRDGSTAEGTGFIYGPRVLATAGHCLYDARQGRDGFIEKVTIIPGANGDEEPFGRIEATRSNAEFQVPAKWKSNMDWRYDYGVILMDEEFDFEIGSLELGDPRDYTKETMMQESLSILGYDTGSREQKISEGFLERIREYDFLYKIPIMPGESGAPVLVDGIVVGIQNYGVNTGDAFDRMPYNSGARLNEKALEFLNRANQE